MKSKFRHSFIFACILSVLLGFSAPGFSLTVDDGSYEDLEGNIPEVHYLCVDEEGNQVDCEGIPDELEADSEDIPSEELDEILNEAQAAQSGDPLFLAGGGSVFSGCVLQAAGQSDLAWNLWILGLASLGTWIPVFLRRR